MRKHGCLQCHEDVQEDSDNISLKVGNKMELTDTTETDDESVDITDNESGLQDKVAGSPNGNAIISEGACTIPVMYVPFLIYMNHSLYVCIIPYMYVPCLIYMYHSLCVCTIPYAYVPFLICMYHFSYICTIL